MTLWALEEPNEAIYPFFQVDQLVAHLRAEIRDGSLSGTMPGVAALVRDLGVGTKTVIAAMEQMESQGLLVPQRARVDAKSC